MEAILTNPAVRLFGLCYLILILKMVAVGWYTSFLRIRDKVYATPEDYAQVGLTPRAGVHEGIERARRAHRNDLENILPFFGVGLLYTLSGPSMFAAQVFLIGFTAARVLHSVFYLAVLQPYRTIAFLIGQVLMLLMLVSALPAYL